MFTPSCLETVAPPERMSEMSLTNSISKKINEGIIAKNAMRNSAHIGKTLKSQMPADKTRKHADVRQFRGKYESTPVETTR